MGNERQKSPSRLALAAWALVIALGVWCYAQVALARAEPVNAVTVILAALCIYAVARRFYATFIAAKVFELDDSRVTPAHRRSDGRDFYPYRKWVLFGTHFAAIAGPGPLVGPVLAAQFGYLPGALWIPIGAALGGAVQDFVVLCASLRHDGSTLGEMVRRRLGAGFGLLASVVILAILTILLAVLALVVVNALAESPWGMFTVVASIPIALFIGLYTTLWRPGGFTRATAIGLAALLAAVVLGQYLQPPAAVMPGTALTGWRAAAAGLGQGLTLGKTTLAFLVMAYVLVASSLPVWLLLAPRDNLCAYLKIGTILLLAVGILAIHPQLRMPALTPFAYTGHGPVFGGEVWFTFITIACGAISGFHALVNSGTTPRMLDKEWDAPTVSYGGMLLESFVAIMALIAASVLDPRVYFAVNSPMGAKLPPGFMAGAAQMALLAHQMGEKTLLARTGGGPTLAIGMSVIFSGVKWLGGRGAMAIWYHFAIMFEAMFILTCLDTGTRIMRMMLQDLLGQKWPALGRTGGRSSDLIVSAFSVALWGYWLYGGVTDKLGGVNRLWPLFGISNQLLAVLALTLATTVIFHLGKQRYAWVTGIPLVWITGVTLVTGGESIFKRDPAIGFLAKANAIDAGKIPLYKLAERGPAAFNYRFSAVVLGAIAVCVYAMLVAAIAGWVRWGRNGPAIAPDLERQLEEAGA